MPYIQHLKALSFLPLKQFGVFELISVSLNSLLHTNYTKEEIRRLEKYRLQLLFRIKSLAWHQTFYYGLNLKLISFFTDSQTLRELTASAKPTPLHRCRIASRAFTKARIFRLLISKSRFLSLRDISGDR